MGTNSLPGTEHIGEGDRLHGFLLFCFQRHGGQGCTTLAQPIKHACSWSGTNMHHISCEVWYKTPTLSARIEGWDGCSSLSLDAPERLRRDDMDSEERGAGHQGIDNQALGLGNMRTRHPSGRLSITGDQGIHQFLMFTRHLITAVAQGSTEVKQPLALVEHLPDGSAKAAIARGISNGRVEGVICSQ